MRERSLDEQDAIYRAGLRARRQAEQALAASEAKFRAMFTEAKMGIGIGDMEGNITDANPALQEMFGSSFVIPARATVKFKSGKIMRQKVAKLSAVLKREAAAK